MKVTNNVEEGDSGKGGKNLTQHAFAGFIWIMLGSGVQVVLKIGVLAVLARLVSPKVFGVMSIALVVLEFSKMFGQMGVGPALIQRAELEHRHLTAGFTLSLVMGLFFATLLIALSPLISVFFNMPDLKDVLRVISLVFLFDSFTLIAQALLQRNMRFKVVVSFEIISYTVGYGGIGIFLAYQGFGVWALVNASLAQAFLFMMMLVWAQPFPKRLGYDVHAIKDLLFFGGGFTLAKIGNYLATQGDNLVVGKTLGAGALGMYGR
nr:oligosaccharide flippase family protein [Chryseolinea sp.]